MPMYEYLCEDCGQTTEALRPMAQADETIACQHCQSKKTHREHSVFAASVANTAGRSSSLPASGGCCPCGKNQGSCSR